MASCGGSVCVVRGEGAPWCVVACEGIEYRRLDDIWFARNKYIA